MSRIPGVLRCTDSSIAVLDVPIYSNIRAAQAYWLAENTLYFVTLQGEARQRHSIDRELTIWLNRAESGLTKVCAMDEAGGIPNGTVINSEFLAPDVLAGRLAKVKVPIIFCNVKFSFSSHVRKLGLGGGSHLQSAVLTSVSHWWFCARSREASTL